MLQVALTDIVLSSMFPLKCHTNIIVEIALSIPSTNARISYNFCRIDYRIIYINVVLELLHKSSRNKNNH